MEYTVELNCSSFKFRSVKIVKMLKISSIIFLLALSFEGNFAAGVPFSENILDIQLLSVDSRISSTWGEHAKDFVELIDVDKLLAVVFGYLKDPEVMNFVTFILSGEFKQIVWEFESMPEFKEVRMNDANCCTRQRRGGYYDDN